MNWQIYAVAVIFVAGVITLGLASSALADDVKSTTTGSKVSSTNTTALYAGGALLAVSTVWGMVLLFQWQMDKLGGILRGRRL